jgi:hypothetical protein
MWVEISGMEYPAKKATWKRPLTRAFTHEPCDARG